MAFTPKNYVDQVGPAVPAAWLNGVDVTVNSVMQGAQTLVAAQTALGIINTQQSIGAVLYPVSAAETSAGVTPVNQGYPVLNVLRYGADPTGVADSTTAINNAILVARVNGGLVHLPGGTYTTSATLAVGDYSGVWIKGDGAGITIIEPTSGLGSNPVISFGSTTGALNQGFHDLSILCANATGATGVSVYQANGFWAENFLIQQANIGILISAGVIQFYNNWQINRSGLYGIQLTGTGSGGNDRYFSNGVMSNVGFIQPTAGIFLQASAGDWLSNLDLICQGTGLYASPGAGQAVEWLFAVNIACDTCSNDGIALSPASGGSINSLDFTACWSSSASNFGVYFSGAGTINGVRLNGCRVFNNQNHGIVLSAGSPITNTQISNCDVAGNSAPVSPWNSATQYSFGNLVTLSGTTYQATAASLNKSPPNGSYWSVYSASTANGIYIGAGVSAFSLNYNRVGSEAGQGTTQGYGIIVIAGASNNYSIIGNDVRGNITAGLIDFGTGSSKTVHSNTGYNPLGATAITVAASPFTFTNTTGAPIAVQVNGGTVSGITVNTQGLGSIVAGQFVVPQGESIVVTYTVAPTMVYYGVI